jgi:trans-2,3-dihydro-3-hydroxyanthranilate isomerase
LNNPNGRNKQFVVVNAFADGAFGGNPAGVFTHADGLDGETMQAIARQLNLVETVFVLSGDDDSDFRLRYFTPNGEIPVAGHPTIAAWIALLHTGVIADEEREYRQSNLAGTQSIQINHDEGGQAVVTMRQPDPQFMDTSCTKPQAAWVFGLADAAIDGTMPIKAVNTGLGHLIVPLKSLDNLMTVKRQIEPLRQLCQAMGVREAQLFCFETNNKSYDIHTRNLCPREGLEDPACGVGNGALSAYLAEYVWREKTEFYLKLEQGTIVDMPSVIYTRTTRDTDGVSVFVGGQGVVMIEGQFLV